MNMQKKKIGIVGAGKVGSVLARGLATQGYQLTGIASHTLESASQLAKEFGVKGTMNAADFMQDTEVLFITTPDRCIREVTEEIALEKGTVDAKQAADVERILRNDNTRNRT